jgi:hypothetical protein
MVASDGTEPERRPYWTAERLELMRESERQRQTDDAAFAGRANRRFLRFSIDAHRRWPGVKWVNQPDGGRHYSRLGKGNGWKTFPMLGAETPRFRTKSRKASNLADLCEFDSPFWLLTSARCTEVFARLQPEAVDILPVEVELGDGAVLPAGAYNMVDVVNILPAYDRAASGLVVEERDGRRYLPDDFSRVILRDEVVAGAHAFRDEVDRISIWVSVELRDALRKARVTSAGYAWPDRMRMVEFRG